MLSLFPFLLIFTFGVIIIIAIGKGTPPNNSQMQNTFPPNAYPQAMYGFGGPVNHTQYQQMRRNYFSFRRQRNQPIFIAIMLIVTAIVGLLAYNSIDQNNPSSSHTQKEEKANKFKNRETYGYQGGDMSFDEDVGRKDQPSKLEETPNTYQPSLATVSNSGRQINVAPVNENNSNHAHRVNQTVEFVGRPRSIEKTANLFYAQFAASKTYEAAISRLQKEENLHPGKVFLCIIKDGSKYPYKLLRGGFSTIEKARAVVGNTKAIIHQGDKGSLFSVRDI